MVRSVLLKAACAAGLTHQHSVCTTSVHWSFPSRWPDACQEGIEGLRDIQAWSVQWQILGSEVVKRRFGRKTLLTCTKAIRIGPDCPPRKENSSPLAVIQNVLQWQWVKTWSLVNPGRLTSFLVYSVWTSFVVHQGPSVRRPWRRAVGPHRARPSCGMCSHGVGV